MRKSSANKNIQVQEADATADFNDNSKDDAVSAFDRVIGPGEANSAMFNFVPTSKLKGMEDWIDEGDQLQFVQQSKDFSVAIEPDDRLLFPPLLRAFTYPRGEIARFPSPSKSSLGTSSKCLYGLEALNWVQILLFCRRLLFDGCRFSATGFGT